MVKFPTFRQELFWHGLGKIQKNGANLRFFKIGTAPAKLQAIRT
ncbi:hypothetical protein EBBID32_15310 [Sphingobium indicum BiD32]|uniref:Uncharacterized protein n=1 Tax=Sphingobium indicum BiD32 TaxID=1301087 RepID=N1MNN5_9SPHN|nr:hypothetical protein EBBID32_15310 [Sphingobium indicum BiD32]